jgi:hypothetical protein
MESKDETQNLPSREELGTGEKMTPISDEEQKQKE